MKNLVLILFFAAFNTAQSQVGINTSHPKATFEVHKNNNSTLPEGIIPPKITADSLQLKDALYGENQDGALVYITQPVNPSLSSLKTQLITNTGYYIYDAQFSHPDSSLGIWNPFGKVASNNFENTIYSAKAETGLSLLSLGINLLGSEFKIIQLDNISLSNIISGNGIINNNQYVVPDDGLYMINYDFKFGQGISAQLLSSQKPSIAISKTSAGTTSLLDYRSLGGINLIVANVSLTEGQINQIHELKAGDLLNFGVVTGGLNLTLLGDASARINVRRIQ